MHFSIKKCNIIIENDDQNTNVDLVLLKTTVLCARFIISYSRWP